MAAELKPLLPDLSLDERPRAVVVRLWDLGARYRVSVGGLEREIVDEPRDCQERALAAAALILLALKPPTMPTSPLAPAANSRPQQTVTRLTAPRFELELDGVVEGAPRTGSDRGLLVGGGALRASLHGRTFGGSLGAEGLSSDAMQFDAARVRLFRVPFDLSLRGVLAARRFDLVFDLGFALTVLHVEGVGLQTVQAATRAEPGLRAGVALRVWLAPRLGLIFGADAVFAFQASQLAVEPVGVVGTTPTVWIGAIAGMVVRIH